MKAGSVPHYGTEKVLAKRALVCSVTANFDKRSADRVCSAGASFAKRAFVLSASANFDKRFADDARACASAPAAAAAAFRCACCRTSMASSSSSASYCIPCREL